MKLIGGHQHANTVYLIYHIHCYTQMSWEIKMNIGLTLCLSHLSKIALVSLHRTRLIIALSRVGEFLI